ncbi:hypothetical protein K3495_g9100 [Podosphaera aphanis]|nr:hypothetical protein K3495_g9100 [Podosphaera aphanis]
MWTTELIVSCGVIPDETLPAELTLAILCSMLLSWTGKIGWRICVDYRQLNKVIKKNAHTLPYAYDEIQCAAGHKYYAFLDLKNGFWQIRMNEADREKSAFVTPSGVYE